jgi:hypothetical protein
MITQRCNRRFIMIRVGRIKYENFLKKSLNKKFNWCVKKFEQKI